MRAPLQPSGCPRAIAGSNPISRTHAIAQVRALERFADRSDRSDAHDFGPDAERRGDDARHWCPAAPLCGLAAAEE